jgi:hypothetical protein
MDERPRVFVAWDHTNREVRRNLDFLTKELNARWTVEALALGPTPPAGSIWETVRTRITHAQGVLAIMDEPNANVAFELGWALAQEGKHVRLMCVEEKPPAWMDAAPLHETFSAGNARDLDVWEKALNAFAAHPGSWTPAMTAAPAGEQTLLLCPSGSSGKPYRKRLTDLVRWKDPLAGPDGVPLTGLPELLRGVGRVVWVLPAPPGNELRDGHDNARLAVVAGFAYGSGRSLEVLWEHNDRKVLDVFHKRSTFTDLESFCDLIRTLADPAPGPTDLRLAWRLKARSAHTQLLPFLASLEDSDLARLHITLDVHTLAGWSHDSDGPARTLHGQLAAKAIRKRGTSPSIEPTSPEGRTLQELLLAAATEPNAPRWAILADPGAGKTCSARAATQALAENPNAPLPVYVSLAAWSAEPTLTDLLEHACKQAGLPDTLATLQQARQERGGLVLLLDGLDEVPPDRRTEAHNLIEALARAPAWGLVPIVVLGRHVAFRRSVLPAVLEPFELAALDDHQQKDLMLRLIGEEARDALWPAVEAQHGLTDLRRNPLLLTLISVVAAERARDGAELPAHRSEVYQEAVHLLLRRGHCVPPTPVRDPTTAWDVLVPLALRLHERPGELWLKREVEEIVVREILRKRPELEQSVKTWWPAGVGSLLDDLRDNAGLLCAVGGEHGPWGFIHRSVREFLAAEALESGWWPERVESAEGWLRRLKEAQGEADKQQRERKQREPQEDPPESPFDRWGEVLALWAARTADQGEALVRLAGAADTTLGHRAVLAADKLPGPMRLALWVDFDETDEDEVSELGAGEPPTVRDLRAAVGLARTTKGLGLLWHLLELAGAPPDRAWFFGACGRGLPTSLSPAAVRIEAGGFLMGSLDAVGDGIEYPQHQVTLTRPFLLGRTAVTREAYAAFDAAHTCPGGPTHPVTEVTWYEAQLYATWLSEGGRLPTEAEWEYACRAGTTTRWSHGHDEANLVEYAWFRKNAQGEIHPVGELFSNPWGLHDMHGNAWEWCQDGWRDYDATPQVDPIGPLYGERIVRGGGSRVDADYCRSDCRVLGQPQHRNVGVGFRVRLPAPAREL